MLGLSLPKTGARFGNKPELEEKTGAGQNNKDVVRNLRGKEQETTPVQDTGTLEEHNSKRFVNTHCFSPHRHLAADTGPPPDGGLTAWSQVLAGHLACAATGGYINSWGVFQTYYVETLHLNNSDIAWIGSIQTFLMAAIGVISGRAADAGFAHEIFLAGTLLIALGIFTSSLATHYWQILLSQGLCVGLGIGLLYAPALALPATYFSKKKPFVSSIVSSGTGSGGLIFPAMVQQLLPRIGYAWTVRSVAFLALAMALAAVLLLRPRTQPRRTGSLVDWSAFHERPYVLFAAAWFLIFWALYFGLYYTVNLLLIINAVGIPGRIITGLLAAKLTGPLNMVIPILVISSILLLCWIAVHTLAGLYIFVILYGFFSAAAQGLFGGGLVTLTDDPSKLGARVGMIFTIVSIPVLTGPPLAGAIIAREDGSYTGAQIWAAIVTLIGALLLFAARIAKVGWGLGKMA